MAAPKNDPWARKEAWRFTGPFSRANRFRGHLPGIGIGAGAFVLLNIYEYLTGSNSH
ncbi:hypothetical protein TRVA0_022S00980 [Trichomonascus vanleenenianus]|uniref:NADH dehydrogenase [ubiquinone] 1 beta subcomplex subunit 3 n=1 Tax=Trichomonascus vanleenenianus TaxID=2268995 RepID=UPI003ECA61F3